MSPKVWKTAVIILFIFQSLQAWQLWVCKDSIDNCLKFSYENAAQICTSGYFDPERETYAFAHAYRSSFDRDAPKNLINTLLAIGDRNLLCVDWSNEANSILFGLDYIVFAKKVADELTLALSYMYCLRPERTHLIGMSLGSHLAGNAAREYWKLTGNLIGEVNFWPNTDMYIEKRYQPGCTETLLAPFYIFTKPDLCSHLLPLLWYTDSFKYPCQLLGTKADSVQAWVDSQGAPKDLTCIGDLVNQQYTGNYYMRTNAESPYGLGLPGLLPHNKTNVI